jgi:hypothetical protein
VRLLISWLVAAGALLAQQRDPRELVRQSIRNGEQAWRQSFEYECTKHEIDREFDRGNRLRKTDDDVYDVIPLGYGTSFDLPKLHNHEPPSREQKAKAERELARLRAESPGQKKSRFQKEAGERSYMKEVGDAFDFRLVGTENLPTGPAWVLEATPRKGYQPRTRYGHMFPAMRGKLWIDQKDVQWVKADAVAMDTVSFGFFIARLAKGSHIILEQMKLPDGAWVPKRVEAKASARSFLLFNHNFEEDITYSDYRRPAAKVAAR